MIEGAHFVRKLRPGKLPRWYVYAWRGGPCVFKADGVRRPSLGPAELKAIAQAHEDLRRPDPTTLLALIREWRSEDPAVLSSPEWEQLSKNTQRVWGSALNTIEAKWGQTPLVVWSNPRMTPKVVQWRDSRASTPRAADMGVMVLKALLAFGRLRGRVSINVAERIPKLYKGGGRAEIIWTDDDIARFMESANTLGLDHVSDALRLAALTGLRREDLVTLTWDQVGDVAITMRAAKKSAGKRRTMTMPRIPMLSALLDELRGRNRLSGVDTVLVNSQGKAWTGSGLSGQFIRVRDAAKIEFVDPDTGKARAKHLHDVRGTFCTNLMLETDLSNEDIADIMAWSPQQVSQIRKVLR